MFKMLIAAALFVASVYYLVGPEDLGESTRMAWTAAQGWDQEACREYPVECLESKHEKLVETRDKLQSSVYTLRDQRQSLLSTTATASAQADASKTLLVDAREVLNSQAEGPYRFANGTYPTRESLREQVKLLLNEYNNNKAIASEGVKVAEQLKERGYKIQRHIKKLESQIKIYPARIELARAQQHVNSTLEAASTMDRVLEQADSEINADESVVTDSKGLARRAGTDKGSSVDVDEFLENGLKE